MQDYPIAIPGAGEFREEHVFYELDCQPVLFTCRDRSGRLYLFSNCQFLVEYIFTKTTPEQLLDLISDETPIRDLFDPEKTRFTTWDGERFSAPEPIGQDMLPQEGALLELDDEETAAYARKLKEKTA